MRLATCLIMLGALAPLGAARAARAQIFDPKPNTAPRVWLSAGVGYQDMGGIDDGRTDSGWDFQGAAQFRGSLEVALGSGSRRGGATVGVVGSWSHVPMLYFTQGGRTDAHADVSSLMGMLRIGGGTGLHQVIELSAGAMRFAKFERDDDGTALPPTSDVDLGFNIGYGFGYTLGRSAQIALVQDYGLSFHQKDGLDNSATRTLRQQTTRISVRLGLFGGSTRR